eukprot:TRINITY_DN13373_c0_g1_i2.p3 TRINITY_DN13373_c0_g1~~TRINITY_DN13373_c0_g1_i2.p3  ORF type:complete len:145 (-),score=37.24 TRINITY_DN13373_c0_g1_i2:70-504(-)
MGGFFSTLTDLLQDKPLRCLIVGLDNSGKSTLLHVLSSGKAVQMAPSVAPHMEELDVGGLNIKAVDLPGRGGFKTWERFLPTCNAIIFVVDSSDPDRIGEARTALHSTMSHPEVVRNCCPLLVLSNKVDRSRHMSELAVIEGTR